MLKNRYPRIQKRFGRLSAYIQLVRPFTLLAPFLAGILGVLASIQQITFDSFTAAVYVGLTLAMAQATGQIINQYADVELDKIVKPYRPLPSEVLTREEALGLAWLFAIFSIARAFTINPIFGLGTTILIFFAVFYSLSPFSPRKIDPVLNVLWMAISRGFIPMLLVWTVYSTINAGLPYALLAFVWVLGFQSTKDIEDVIGDTKFGIKTIVSDYGSRGLLFSMLLCTLIYIVLCFYFKLYIMLLLFPIAFFSMTKFDVKSKLTENTYGWTGFYLGLGLIFLLMFANSFFT